jgi:sirohydrochlorin cobaltochelatase
MTGLLVVAHGSRKQASNDEVLALANRIEAIADGVFNWVRCAFVQFAAPTFETQIEDLVQCGASTIVVYPHFLGSGSHVSKDIPQLVKAAGELYPHVQIRITPHLGKIDGIQRLILNQAKEFV